VTVEALRGVAVAQIFNLLYRRIAFCGRRAVPQPLGSSTSCRLQIGDTADCKSALRAGGTRITPSRSKPPAVSNTVAARRSRQRLECVRLTAAFRRAGPRKHRGWQASRGFPNAETQRGGAATRRPSSVNRRDAIDAEGSIWQRGSASIASLRLKVALQHLRRMRRSWGMAVRKPQRFAAGTLLRVPPRSLPLCVQQDFPSPGAQSGAQAHALQTLARLRCVFTGSAASSAHCTADRRDGSAVTTSSRMFL
jgi:hypothetical protein